MPSARRSASSPSTRSASSSRWPGRISLGIGTRASSPASSTPRVRSACGIVRISNGDPTILDWTTFACRRLGLPFVVERGGATGMWNVRIRGGLEQQLRFHHLTNPAITRKRSIEGRASQVAEPPEGGGTSSRSGYGAAALRHHYRTGDFISNGVVSHNCFARPTHEYLDLDAGRDFDKEIVVKVNVPEVLRAELARPTWKREPWRSAPTPTRTSGSRGATADARDLGAMRDFANPCSILTKSPLLLRDKDLCWRSPSARR